MICSTSARVSTLGLPKAPPITALPIPVTILVLSAVVSTQAVLGITALIPALPTATVTQALPTPALLLAT